MSRVTEEKLYCETCRQTMNINQFYSTRNLEKYPSGKLRQCKKCATMFIDNWDPETYLPLLEELDVPYVKEEWDKILSKQTANGSPITGMAVIGRYLTIMRLNQYKDARWADSERIAAERISRKADTMEKQGFTPDQIKLALDYDTTPAKPRGVEPPVKGFGVEPTQEERDVYEEQLTEDDKMYLSLKWGKNYRAEEWVKLEQLYEDMMASYDIQTAGHKDTLKMICKTSLKANQLIDMGDVDGFQKMSRVYDSLMKAGKFTAAQNKAESGEFIDSIGELVLICEKEGFIPRYYVEQPNDKPDRVLQDYQKYVHNLITEETNLNELIASAVKNMQQEEEEIESANNNIGEDDDTTFEAMLFDEEEKLLRDKDFEELRAMIEEDYEETEARVNEGDDLYSTRTFTIFP